MAVVPIQLPWLAMMKLKGGLTEYFLLTTKTFISIEEMQQVVDNNNVCSTGTFF